MRALITGITGQDGSYLAEFPGCLHFFTVDLLCFINEHFLYLINIIASGSRLFHTANSPEQVDCSRPGSRQRLYNLI